MFGIAVRFLKRENISTNNGESLFKQIQEYWLWTRESSNRSETMFADTQYLFSRRQWHPTPVLLPGKSHGLRSLVGCIPWGCEESDTAERLHFHFSLSCIGEGNGNPLQCSCLENPRDEEPGGLPSMGSHGVGHDWSDLAAAAAVLILMWKKWTC